MVAKVTKGRLLWLSRCRMSKYHGNECFQTRRLLIIYSKYVSKIFWEEAVMTIYSEMLLVYSLQWANQKLFHIFIEIPRIH